MLIYYESKVKDSPIAKQIFEKFGNCEKIEIQHYKNIFDINIGSYTTEPCMILAKQDHIAILPTPDNYGFPGKSFFFKPSLNCFYNCKYCYLQGTFRNRFPVFFLNYKDMQDTILKKIKEEREKGFTGQITFYASNYTDLLATEDISKFHSYFLPFCDTLPKDTLIETRTKSDNISEIIKYSESLNGKYPTQNIEIAFSLSPGPIATEYEIGTAKLDNKIKAINTLLTKNFRVGLRFLPLLPVNDYENIYSNFLKEITSKIDYQKISSITIAPIIFNEGDFSILQKKQSNFYILNKLRKNEHNLYTLTDEEIKKFESIFKNYLSGKSFFRDYR